MFDTMPSPSAEPSLSTKLRAPRVIKLALSPRGENEQQASNSAADATVAIMTPRQEGLVSQSQIDIPSKLPIAKRNSYMPTYTAKSKIMQKRLSLECTAIDSRINSIPKSATSVSGDVLELKKTAVAQGPEISKVSDAKLEGLDISPLKDSLHRSKGVSRPLTPPSSQVPKQLHTAYANIELPKTPLGNGAVAAGNHGSSFSQMEDGNEGFDYESGLSASQRVRLGLSTLQAAHSVLQSSRNSLSDVTPEGKSMHNSKASNAETQSRSNTIASESFNVVKDTLTDSKCIPPPLSPETLLRRRTQRSKSAFLVSKLLPARECVDSLLSYVNELKRSELLLRLQLDHARHEMKEMEESAALKIRALESDLVQVTKDRDYAIGRESERIKESEILRKAVSDLEYKLTKSDHVTVQERPKEEERMQCTTLGRQDAKENVLEAVRDSLERQLCVENCMQASLLEVQESDQESDTLKSGTMPSAFANSLDDTLSRREAASSFIDAGSPPVFILTPPASENIFLSNVSGFTHEKRFDDDTNTERSQNFASDARKQTENGTKLASNGLSNLRSFARNSPLNSPIAMKKKLPKLHALKTSSPTTLLESPCISPHNFSPAPPSLFHGTQSNQPFSLTSAAYDTTHYMEPKIEDRAKACAEGDRTISAPAKHSDVEKQKYLHEDTAISRKIGSFATTSSVHTEPSKQNSPAIKPVPGRVRPPIQKSKPAPLQSRKFGSPSFIPSPSNKSNTAKPTLESLLTAFFIKHQANRVAEIPKLVEKYKGNEVALVAVMRRRYGSLSVKQLEQGVCELEVQSAADPASQPCNSAQDNRLPVKSCSNRKRCWNFAFNSCFTGLAILSAAIFLNVYESHRILSLAPLSRQNDAYYKYCGSRLSSIGIDAKSDHHGAYTDVILESWEDDYRASENTVPEMTFCLALEWKHRLDAVRSISYDSLYPTTRSILQLLPYSDTLLHRFTLHIGGRSRGVNEYFSVLTDSFRILREQCMRLGSHAAYPNEWIAHFSIRYEWLQAQITSNKLHGIYVDTGAWNTVCIALQRVHTCVIQAMARLYTSVSWIHTADTSYPEDEAMYRASLGDTLTELAKALKTLSQNNFCLGPTCHEPGRVYIEPIIEPSDFREEDEFVRDEVEEQAETTSQGLILATFDTLERPVHTADVTDTTINEAVSSAPAKEDKATAQAMTVLTEPYENEPILEALDEHPPGPRVYEDAALIMYSDADLQASKWLDQTRSSPVPPDSTQDHSSAPLNDVGDDEIGLFARYEDEAYSSESSVPISQTAKVDGDDEETETDKERSTEVEKLSLVDESVKHALVPPPPAQESFDVDESAREESPKDVAGGNLISAFHGQENTLTKQPTATVALESCALSESCDIDSYIADSTLSQPHAAVSDGDFFEEIQVKQVHTETEFTADTEEASNSIPAPVDLFASERSNERDSEPNMLEFDQVDLLEIAAELIVHYQDTLPIYDFGD